MKLQKRTVKGSKIRDKNIVAGVIYGGGIESTSIQADAMELAKSIENYGTSKTFNVTLEGKKHIVFIKDYLAQVLNQSEYVHFDLMKVSAGDTLTSKVRVIWMNKEIPEKRGLILNSALDEVEIEYEVGSGVSQVEVDVTEVQEHDILHVSDIIPIEGIKILDDPEAPIISVSTPKEIVEEDTDEQDPYFAPEEEAKEEE